MGPQMLAALAVAGAGTAVSNAADKRAAGDRRNILNRSMDRTVETQGKATDLVLNEAGKYSPDQRLADMKAQEDANYQQAQKDGAIPGAVPGATQGQARAMSLGDADKALAEGNRMTAIARELAKVRAPGQLGAKDSARRAEMAGETGSMWSNDRAQSNAAGLDAQSVSAPWWGTLGKVAQSAGMMMAGNAMGGAAAATATGGGAGAFSRMDRGQVNWK